MEFEKIIKNGVPEKNGFQKKWSKCNTLSQNQCLQHNTDTFAGANMQILTVIAKTNGSWAVSIS